MSLLPSSEEEFRRRLSLLAGPPSEAQLWRGESWDRWTDEEGTSLLGRTCLRRVGTSNRTSYDPLRDAPEAFLVHARFGDQVWENGMTWNQKLFDETLRIHERYGPLDPKGELASVEDYWWMMRWLSLAVLGYRSLSDQGRQLRRQVVERISEDLSFTIRWLNLHPDLTENFDKEMSDRADSRARDWHDYGETLDVAEDDTYYRRVGSWLNDKINLQLSRVETHVRFSPPNSWLPSYRVVTLEGALWSQLANVVLDGSAIKRCKNPGCAVEPLFSTPNPRKDYCSSKCKETSKKRRQRRNGDVE